MTRNFVLYAPNVHTGGGGVLLRALLSDWPKGLGSLTFFLDSRLRPKLCMPAGVQVYWVEANVRSRVKAEFDLQTCVCNPRDVILCFHGLPPILPNVAEIIVFQQNRNYLGLNALGEFSLKTRRRLLFERLLSWTLRRKVSRYIVQTPSMKRELLRWYGTKSDENSKPYVTIFPFIDNLPLLGRRKSIEVAWEFVYVADGEAHKNHRRLLEAWVLLASEGIRPSLALTLGPKDLALSSAIESARLINDLAIVDLGPLTREQVFDLYASTGALIFPSTSESFGLPLVEAAHFGVPILAAERDYVRDVCVPEQTFDPLSPVSIAKAVKRHLGLLEETPRFNSSREFWTSLLEEF